MKCPDASTFAAYFDLRLPPDETRQLFEHIATCVFCARRLRASATQTSMAPDAAPPPGDLGQSPTTPSIEAAPPKPLLLGRYRVERVLGMGGMGVVYAAHDPELDRDVAIKLLRPSTRGPVSLLRAQLTREAQAMARLSHPNVIHVHEIGTFGEQVFVVMELLDGTTLTEWLQQRPRTWREIVRVFVAAGEGLAAAHAAGVIHRDFKPDNVLISTSGRICVTDFGLARIDREELAAPPEASVPESDARLTYSGRLVGTPGYMAPEQMRGEPTDERSDLFSFCVALYEALLGTRPFRGKQLDQLRAAMESGRLEPPTRTGVPIAYRRAIERGLRARPEERQRSMAELLAVLRVDPIARRNRALALTAIVVLLGGSALAVVRERRRLEQCRGAEARLSGIWDGARKQQIRAALAAAAPAWPAIEQKIDRFADAWVAASTQACEAARLRGTESAELFDRRTRCLDDRLSELRAATDLLAGSDGKLGPRAARLADSLSDLERCSDTTNLLVSDVDPPRGAHKVDYDRLRDRLSQERALRIVGKVEESERMLPEIRTEAQRLGYVALQAEADQALGSNAIKRGSFDEAINLLHQSAIEAERVRNDHVIAAAWRDLAFIDLTRGRPEDGLVWTAYADAIDERLKLPNAVRAGTASYRVAMLAQLGRSDETLAAAHHVLELAAMKPKDEHEASVLDGARDNAVIALAQIGHVAEASALEREMHDRSLRERGREHSFTIIYEITLAQLLVLEHHEAEALPLAEEALQLAATRLGPEAVETGDALAGLGAAEAGLGRLDAAADHLRRGLAIYARAEVTGPSLVDTLTRLASVERRLGRADAVALLERALRAGETDKVSPFLLAPPRFALAEALPRSDRARALGLARQARDAFAAAAHSGADHAAEERDRVDAWLRANAPPSHPPLP